MGIFDLLSVSHMIIGAISVAKLNAHPPAWNKTRRILRQLTELVKLWLCKEKRDIQRSEDLNGWRSL
jgi:hypothetical protein